MMKIMFRFVLIFIAVLFLGYLTLIVYFSVGHIDFSGKGEYYITEDIYVSQTSGYSVTIRGKFGIPAFVYKVGWNDKYVVAMQYDLMNESNSSNYKAPDNQKLIII